MISTKWIPANCLELRNGRPDFLNDLEDPGM